VTALTFDRHGSRIWRQAAALLEYEHARHAITSVAVPYGTCAEPSHVQPLLAQEEFAQYANANALLGLNDVSLSLNVDLLIASGPANEINTILSDPGLGSSL